MPPLGSGAIHFGVQALGCVHVVFPKKTLFRLIDFIQTFRTPLLHLVTRIQTNPQCRSGLVLCFHGNYTGLA